MTIRFEDRWAWAMESVGPGIMQVKDEAAALYAILATREVRTFVEIGSAHGGTLLVYSGVCSPGARIISVDDGREEPHLSQALVRLADEGFACFSVRGNSHDAETRRKVLEIVAEGQADALHIDAEHEGECSLHDWLDYGPLVRRPGGIIAFHDIAYRGGNCGVPEVWDRVRDRGRGWLELLGREAPYKGYHQGIGVIWT